jgi:hypothetical protein
MNGWPTLLCLASLLEMLSLIEHNRQLIIFIDSYLSNLYLLQVYARFSHLQSCIASAYCVTDLLLFLIFMGEED